MAIITISRGTFSGGQSLAECIANKLGYRCISREVLVDASKEYGIDEKKLYKALIEKPGILERLRLDRYFYIACIQAALLKEVKDNNVVYHGHAGHLLLREVPHVFRVRVIANQEQRIKAAMERHGFNRYESLEYIENVDKQRAKWTKFLYHIDWYDPSLYDVLMNLEHISISGACDIICDAANMEEFKTTTELLRTIDDLSLSADAKARVIAHENLRDVDINIKSRWGVLTIKGTVGLPEEEEMIKKIVQNTPGVRTVNSDIRVRADWTMVQGKYLR